MDEAPNVWVSLAGLLLVTFQAVVIFAALFIALVLAPHDGDTKGDSDD